MLCVIVDEWKEVQIRVVMFVYVDFMMFGSRYIWLELQNKYIDLDMRLRALYI